MNIDGLPEVVNRAIFPIKWIVYDPFGRRTRFVLDRPSAWVLKSANKNAGLEGSLFPLRKGQVVSFDTWYGSTHISAVGEGFIEVDDIAFVGFRGCPALPPTVMVREEQSDP